MEKLTQFPWRDWLWHAFKYKVRLINWADNASVPGTDFDYFKAEGSQSVIGMVEPWDLEVFNDSTPDATKGVRVKAWTDGKLLVFANHLSDLGQMKRTSHLSSKVKFQLL